MFSKAQKNSIFINTIYCTSSQRFFIQEGPGVPEQLVQERLLFVECAELGNNHDIHVVHDVGYHVASTL